MDYVTKGLEPADALRYFEEISAIPRGSRNEKGIADYLCAFAKEHHLECLRDEANNVVIKKPGSVGCEKLPPLMLQGHVDMVCVSLPGCKHDFTKDPLELEIRDGKLTAKGTTLGADDGTACATMLAFLAREDYVHPPLECVFTTMEEIGLLGAKALDPSWITARRLLNMDSGASEDYQTTVSCAGGLIYDFVRAPQWAPARGEALAFSIRGLKGGHSAITIGEGRGNGLKLMARVLHAVAAAMELQIADFRGGMKMNAIVGAADALVTVPTGRADEARAIADRAAAEIKAELSLTDPGFTFAAAPAKLPQRALAAADGKALVDFVFLMPDGVRAMSREIAGLVQCSSNIGVLTMDEKEIRLTDCIRSAEDSLGALIAAELTELAALLGFESTLTNSFPGWKYDANSPLRAAGARLFKQMFGREMELQATHGGLECGELKGKFPDMDIMTLAPTCAGAHTPEETVDLASFKRVCDYLTAFLAELCKA